MSAVVCDQAFTTALNCADMDLVTWVAFVVGSNRSPASVAPSLSPIIQLCLLQQLSQQLELHTLLKVAWLEALGNTLNPNDPGIDAHVPAVLADVSFPVVVCVCAWFDWNVPA
jgi:hypothetical protein